MSKNDTLEAFAGKTPQLGQNVFVANGARVIGDVTLEDNVNIWHNAVLRGDVHPIFIGANTNIQDNSTVHVMHDYPAIIGRDVTVGHNAIVHGCKVGNNCLIGMGAILLSYCEIGDNCIVAAGSLVPERKVIPPGSLVMGSPAKVVRSLTEEDIAALQASAQSYVELAAKYMNNKE